MIYSLSMAEFLSFTETWLWVCMVTPASCWLLSASGNATEHSISEVNAAGLNHLPEATMRTSFQRWRSGVRFLMWLQLWDATPDCSSEQNKKSLQGTLWEQKIPSAFTHRNRDQKKQNAGSKKDERRLTQSVTGTKAKVSAGNEEIWGYCRFTCSN